MVQSYNWICCLFAKSKRLIQSCAIISLLCWVSACSGIDAGPNERTDKTLAEVYVYCLHQPRLFSKKPILVAGGAETKCEEEGYFRATAHAFHAALRWHRFTVGYPGYEIQFLNSKTRTVFNNYTLLAEHKAFAVLAFPPEKDDLPWIVLGAFAVSNQKSKLKASIEAIENCETALQKRKVYWPCQLYSVDDEVVWKGRKLSP